MSKKRMFSPDITNSDPFVEMPLSSQALYIHFCMRADDDGFVFPKIIMRMVGANEDDLRVLIAKRFVIMFDSGVIVIKHWRMNNYMRKDRYKPTNYLDEKNLLYVKENMAYTLDSAQGTHISQAIWKDEKAMRSTIGQPNGDQRVTQVRLGKVSNNNKHGAKNAPAAKKPRKSKKPDSIVAKLYYEAIKALDVPVRNNNNVYDKIRELEKEPDRQKVVNYLIFMRDKYPSLVMERKPHINEALDIYAKRQQIRNLLELEQRQKAGAGYE